MSSSSRKSDLSKAIEAYEGKDQILLSNLYDILTTRVELHAVVDSRRGAKLGTKWIIDVKESNDNELKENTLLDISKIIEFAAYLNLYYGKSAKDIYQLYAWSYSSVTYGRYMLNLSTFCLGGHIASYVKKYKTKTEVVDQVYKVLKVKNSTASRSLASSLANRAVRYYGFISSTGLDNPFSSLYTRELICKSDQSNYRSEEH